MSSPAPALVRLPTHLKLLSSNSYWAGKPKKNEECPDRELWTKGLARAILLSAGVYALAARRRVVRRRPTNECNALMLVIFLQYPAARSHETSHELTWPEMMRRTRMSENVCLNRLQMNLRPAFKLAMGLAMMAVMLLSSRASAQELGTARAWGRNTFGQLGDGTTVVRTTPVPVSGLANVTAIASGGSHGLAMF